MVGISIFCLFLSPVFIPVVVPQWINAFAILTYFVVFFPLSCMPVLVILPHFLTPILMLSIISVIPFISVIVIPLISVLPWFLFVIVVIIIFPLRLPLLFVLI